MARKYDFFPGSAQATGGVFLMIGIFSLAVALAHVFGGSPKGFWVTAGIVGFGGANIWLASRFLSSRGNED